MDDMVRFRALRLLVAVLAGADQALDALLYRPAVVRAFQWAPRWWLCDLAKLSMRLDDAWATGWWDADSWVPGGPCEACGRRAAIHVYGGREADDEPIGDFLEGRPVHTCGWCRLVGPMTSEADVQRELGRAGAESVSWRWRQSRAS